MSSCSRKLLSQGKHFASHMGARHATVFLDVKLALTAVIAGPKVYRAD
jgi:hypothetical protein